jgi:hypothetical protein
MDDIIKKLHKHIKTIPVKFQELGETAINQKHVPEKWSKKEILGHLVDSAINNLQRIIRVQYDPEVKIVYHQNEWVKIQNYQNLSTETVLNLWVSLNQQFIHVVESFPAEKQGEQIDTGKTTIELHTAEYIITDYLAHMEHHLNQIFKAEV